jgi:hypothetical protein
MVDRVDNMDDMDCMDCMDCMDSFWSASKQASGNCRETFDAGCGMVVMPH